MHPIFRYLNVKKIIFFKCHISVTNYRDVFKISNRWQTLYLCLSYGFYSFFTPLPLRTIQKFQDFVWSSKVIYLKNDLWTNLGRFFFLWKKSLFLLPVHLFKIRPLNSLLKPVEKTQENVPQVLETDCNLSCYTLHRKGCMILHCQFSLAPNNNLTITFCIKVFTIQKVHVCFLLR